MKKQNHNGRNLALLLFLGLTALLALSGCSDDDDQVVGPGGGEEEEEYFAWLWAFDADQDSLRIYDLDSGNLMATFHADPHNTIHEVQAGPDGEPTVWMGSQGMGYGFTAGFHMHGDHAHMEVPEAMTPITTGSSNVHMSADSHGETVAWANDGDQTFTLVDTETGTVTTLGHGSPHSAAMVGHEYLMATHMNEKWARLIDLETNTIAAQVEIDTLAHGDAFHHDSETVFISCLNRVEVLDMEAGSLLTPIDYPDAGRCNFLLHGGEATMALGPVRLSGADADEVFLLDMEQRSMSSLAINGSALAWNRGGGNIALSGDGTLAVLTDLNSAKAYLVGLDGTAAGALTTLTVAEANMAAALDHNGHLLCLLDKTSGEVHLLHMHEGTFENEGHVDVHAGSDWIFITSLDHDIEAMKDF